MSTLGLYSYILRGVAYDLPFMEMIKSALPVVDEVCIVTDPRFKDGTIQALRSLDDERISINLERLD